MNNQFLLVDAQKEVSKNEEIGALGVSTFSDKLRGSGILRIPLRMTFATFSYKRSAMK